jgi:pimeloyl-ACP methyl ester carboxylesterase
VTKAAVQRRLFFHVSVTLCALLSLLQMVDAEEWGASIAPTSADNFYEANIRLWLPDSGRPLQAVLLLIGGTDSDWRGMAASQHWRSFAENNRLALVGCHFRGNGEPYEQAERGSGAALLKMLDICASESGRSELGRLPLLLCGYSSGAMFVYNFASWNPGRCKGFVSVKSGPVEAKSDAFHVPALFLVGEKDAERLAAIANVFTARPKENRWALAVEANEGHGFTEACGMLTRSYFQGILESHPNASGSRCDLEKPSSTSATQGQSPNIMWLPSRRVASDWRGFTKAASIVDLGRQDLSERKSPSIDVQPSMIEFGNIDGETKDFFEKTVIVKLGSGDHLRDIRFLPESSALSIFAKRIRSSEYELRVRFAADKQPAGLYRGAIRIVSSDLAPDRAPTIRVTARLEGTVSASPASLYLGVLPRGTVLEKKVEIAVGKSGSRLEVVSSNPAFASVKGRENRGSKLLLTIRFHGSDKCLGNQSGYLAVREGKSQALRIPFIAWVAK